MICNDFRGLEATNPRDKVYGVLGMWQPTPEAHVAIDVDYGKSLAEVYADVVIQAICERKDLFVLRFVNHKHDGNSLEEERAFPSWVPGWDQSGPSFQWLDKSTLSATRYKADIPDAALARSGILEIKGVVFGRMAFISSVLDDGSTSFRSNPVFRQYFIELWLEVTGGV